MGTLIIMNLLLFFLLLRQVYLTPGDPLTGRPVFLLSSKWNRLCYCKKELFDGQNGSASAIYTEANLLNNVLGALPPDLNSDEWVAALPRALVAGLVKTDKDFRKKGDRTIKVGVVDSEYIAHLGLPTLSSFACVNKKCIS